MRHDKDTLRSAMGLPAAADSGLSSMLGTLYRQGATVGSGSTAAAVRQELTTGATVAGRTHSQKATESIRALENWSRQNPTARPGDRAAAENVIRDMQNALRGQ